MSGMPREKPRNSASRTRRTKGAALAVLLCFAAIASVARPAGANDIVPGAPQTRPIVLSGGTIHPVDGPAFVGDLVFADGKITALGKSVETPAGAERIDVSGHGVYPGFFDAWTQLGLVEIESVRATRDERETGAFNPNVKSWVAANPDSELIPVTRANGVLLALTSPTGGTISGQCGVLQLDGWTWEDLTLDSPTALYVRWPRVGGSSATTAGQKNRPLAELSQFFERSSRYLDSAPLLPEHTARDALYESMAGVLTGDVPMMVRAERASEIQSAVAFAEARDLELIIHGGYDTAHCADLLLARKVPVVLGSVYRLPRRRSSPYDEAYTLPARLREAGVRFAISGTLTSSSSNVRNLPWHAGMAVAFGLPHADALAAITLWPAEILGVADRVGSLTVGKDATLFVAKGDPLDTRSSVPRAWIQGREVDLRSRHVQLYEKYREKLRRERPGKDR